MSRLCRRSSFEVDNRRRAGGNLPVSKAVRDVDFVAVYVGRIRRVVDSDFIARREVEDIEQLARRCEKQFGIVVDGVKSDACAVRAPCAEDLRVGAVAELEYEAKVSVRLTMKNALPLASLNLYFMSL